MKRSLAVLTLLFIFTSLLINEASAAKILDVYWEKDGKINVIFDKFPMHWNNWKMYIDGREMSMEGQPGHPIARPNAPIPKATGILIATDPWSTPLYDVKFPCCGTIQFDTRGEGRTNEYYFDLSDQGCRTRGNQCQTPEVEVSSSCDSDECMTRGAASYISYTPPPNTLSIVGTELDAEVYYRSPGENNWKSYDKKTPCSMQIRGNSIQIKLMKPGFRDYISERINVNGYRKINPALEHV
jgi:hypothetical protein